MPRFDACLVTCEHASNAVPVRWRAPFEGRTGVLHTHRGWDPGALLLAQELADDLKAPLFAGQITRLLVDLNRREDNRAAFSEFTLELNPEQRVQLLNLYHRPYRVRVRDAVEEAVSAGRRLLHLSCHSFTPVLDGNVREAEIGLLFDPDRPLESELCTAWQQAMLEALPGSRVRLNYPYLGTDDGVTTWCRELARADLYAGVEIELNQQFAAGEPGGWSAIRRAIRRTLRDCLK
ncbi:MAG: N-formylglutamate amidohydrolase [Planctomycetes bacterium]|nr:N-formylglutamate amidohydrolase [Planctomycetota bacterium]